MNTNLQRDFTRRVQKNYDALSRVYDFMSGKTELRITKYALKMIPFDRRSALLDIGCGTGSALLELKRLAGEKVKLSGIDISFGMCRKARNKMDRIQVADDLSITCANALAIPYRSAVFDYILMIFTFEIFPDDFYRRLLTECERVLKSDGQIILVCMADDNSNGGIFRLYRMAHERFPGIIDCRPVDAGKILEENAFHVIEKGRHNLFGLPVDVIRAAKS